MRREVAKTGDRGPDSRAVQKIRIIPRISRNPLERFPERETTMRMMLKFTLPRKE
jgi:hypothetical protein